MHHSYLRLLWYNYGFLKGVKSFNRGVHCSLWWNEKSSATMVEGYNLCGAIWSSLRVEITGYTYKARNLIYQKVPIQQNTYRDRDTAKIGWMNEKLRCVSRKAVYYNVWDRMRALCGGNHSWTLRSPFLSITYYTRTRFIWEYDKKNESDVYRYREAHNQRHNREGIYPKLHLLYIYEAKHEFKKLTHLCPTSSCLNHHPGFYRTLPEFYPFTRWTACSALETVGSSPLNRQTKIGSKITNNVSATRNSISWEYPRRFNHLFQW